MVDEILYVDAERQIVTVLVIASESAAAWPARTSAKAGSTETSSAAPTAEAASRLATPIPSGLVLPVP